jgi:Rod binding domain-containing protein
VETPAPFGGGQGETMFRSFMTDAFAEQMTRSGGVGIADSVRLEMLKMQGLE